MRKCRVSGGAGQPGAVLIFGNRGCVLAAVSEVWVGGCRQNCCNWFDRMKERFVGWVEEFAFGAVRHKRVGGIAGFQFWRL